MYVCMLAEALLKLFLTENVSLRVRNHLCMAENEVSHKVYSQSGLYRKYEKFAHENVPHKN